MSKEDIDLTLFTSDPSEIETLTTLLQDKEEPISNLTIQHLLNEIRKGEADG